MLRDEGAKVHCALTHRGGAPNACQIRGRFRASEPAPTQLATSKNVLQRIWPLPATILALVITIAWDALLGHGLIKFLGHGLIKLLKEF
jgi:hypothetical protein